MFKGVFPAVVTPLNDDMTVKEDAVEGLLQYFADSGVDGFYVGGSTGEGPILPAETRKRMIRLVKQFAGDRYAVLAHIGSADTMSSAKLAEYAASVGVDAISAVPPYYFRVDTKGLILHYSQICEAAQVPVIVYNIPSLTGTPIYSGVMEELIHIEHVVGIKYTDYDLNEMRKIKELDGGRPIVFYGVDQAVVCGLMMGADGIIGSHYNTMPAAFVQLYRAFMREDMKTAREIQFQVNRYINICSKHRYALSGIKQVMGMIGYDVGVLAAPLRPLRPEDAEQLKQELDRAGFFDFIASTTVTTTRSGQPDRVR